MIHIFSHLHVSPSAENTAENQSWMDPCVMWCQLHTKHTNICTLQTVLPTQLNFVFKLVKKEKIGDVAWPDPQMTQFLNKQRL